MLCWLCFNTVLWHSGGLVPFRFPHLPPVQGPNAVPLQELSWPSVAALFRLHRTDRRHLRSVAEVAALLDIQNHERQNEYKQELKRLELTVSGRVRPPQRGRVGGPLIADVDVRTANLKKGAANDLLGTSFFFL